jgi:hypothetical protein
LELVVEFGAVELERVDAARAFFRHRTSISQKHAHRVAQTNTGLRSYFWTSG